MSDSRGSRLAGRQAAWLFAVCGVLAMIGALTPGDVPRAADAAVAASGLAGAVVLAVLPWHRWRPSRTLWIVPAAFLVIAMFSVVDLIPVRSYGVFFVIVFAWVGLHHPPGVGIKLAPFAAIAYAAPLLLTRSDPPVDPRAVVLAVATCVLVAETIARGQQSAADAQRRIARAASAFREVARTSAALRQLEPEGVLQAVADGVMNLGYQGASLSIIDTETDTFEVLHARGIAAHHMGPRFPASAGLTGQVRDERRPVVIADYQVAERSIAAIRESGVGGAIGVPVHVGEQLAAVLIASSTDPVVPEAEDVEALQILADVAGTALAGARAYQRQRATAQKHSREARTDALTGLANRRYAEYLLAGVAPGDTLVLVDIDLFGDVNERLGHAGGDRVLVKLADHLAHGVRAADVVARFGGEEFLLVMPVCTAEQAGVVVTRLMSTWRALDPATTFSAGIATHASARSVDQTLRRADAALYAAKQAGRDRSCNADDGGAEPVTGRIPRRIATIRPAAIDLVRH